ncbi:uncharacterized protein GBIM_10615, partial [Gryllus bimaculatus]
MKKIRQCFGIVLWLIIVSLGCNPVQSVDRNNFKTCEQSSFCRRSRRVKPGQSPYQLHLNTLSVGSSSISAELVNYNNLAKFKFELSAIKEETFRMKISELSPIRPRYEVESALVGEPELDTLKIIEQTADHVTVQAGANEAKVFAAPFRVDLYSHGQLVISSNARGLLKFEHYRKKPEQKAEEGAGAAEEAVAAGEEDIEADPGAWEENFKSHHDTKPYGPAAVALDFSFVGAHHAYGIPEHADSFALKSTKNTDPYRLYNLDVFEYELWNPMALYGSVPFLIAHGPARTVGVLWLNAAETWVDILSSGDQTVVSSIVNFVSGSDPTPQVDAHFISETGIIDVFFNLGPRPLDVFRQYTKLTGTAPLPQYFAIAYHQSRWNYNDQDDVRMVESKFDEHDLPLDVMWLDIEHTDNKKYFTWDHLRFSQPTEMTQNLTAHGRKLVVIVDPHIKRDGSYFLHNDAESNGYYVKNKEGRDFEGWCWPGSSSYLDFLNPAVQDYYAQRYSLDNFKGSTEDTYIWNDMNEPSVFSGPEVTMHKDCVHHGGWEHREIHNIYALLNTKVTFNGLFRRSEGKLRPFILTRGHFAGSQRYAAVWTGDNAADWAHLRITVPISPDEELITGWYQAAAFQPFFRSHAHIDTKRREPWLFGEETLGVIREALRKRYSLLPLWYTLFREHELTGAPVMQPLWAQFPTETDTFAIDDEYLLGDRLLVHPVTEAEASSVTVYFPGPGQIWYDMDSYEAIHVSSKHSGGRTEQIPVNIRKVPVFQRGGTIVPKKERIRRAASLSLDDPFTLLVALDVNGTASGTVYIDDGRSYEYKQGKYLYLDLKFEGKTLTSRFIDKNSKFPTKAWLERVVIIGWPSAVSKARIESKGMGTNVLEASYNSAAHLLVPNKDKSPGCSFETVQALANKSNEGKILLVDEFSLNLLITNLHSYQVVLLSGLMFLMNLNFMLK